MSNYELEYQQPYEYDDDSGDGHEIGWSSCVTKFSAPFDLGPYSGSRSSWRRARSLWTARHIAGEPSPFVE